MSSELQSVVSSIVDNDYVTIVIVTAVGYDYILTFADEIEYIWSKPWTRVSTLFVLVRYFGLCGVIIYGLSEILGILGEWAMFIFLGAADLVMILRVWAMYLQSRIILGILLTLYIAEIVPFIITCIIISTKFTAVTAKVFDFSFCAYGGGSPIRVEVNDSLEFALSGTMFLLVVAQFIRHSFEMYTVTKQWQPSRYMSLLAREGMLYFLAILLFSLIDILILGANISTKEWRVLVIGTLQYVPAFTLTPRFILSVRALYARDLEGRCAPCDMDTKFGFSSVLARETTIAFSEQREEQRLEQEEEIPTGEGEVGCGV